MFNRFGMYPLILAILVCAQGSYAANGLPVVRIGIVTDGPLQPQGWGKIIRSKLFFKEILDITRGEFDVRFSKDRVVHGNWSVSGVKKAVDALLANPQVDLVLALGVIATNEVSLRRTLPKPVVAPFAIDRKLQDLPFRNGTSGVRNLNYLTLPHSFERDVKVFKEIILFTRMALFVDKVLIEALPRLRVKAARAAKENGIQLAIIPVGNRIQPALAALPADVETVFVTPLLSLPPSEFDVLVAGLIDRRLPSFSLFGREEVERGLLASASQETNTLRLARRVALNVHRILLGEDAGDLGVTMPRGERLTINMATARAIGSFPSFRVLTEAELLNEEEEQVTRRLSLYTAMREAISVNLDLAAADRRVAAGLGEVGIARSFLLPQVDIGSSASVIDADRAKGGLGNNPEQAVFATGSLRQLLYSDSAWSNFTVQEKTQESRIAQRQELQLDIVREAGVAYLNVLRTKTIKKIQKGNLKLTRSNLELARVRESVGAAARDEVFRWESEIALGRIDVLNAQARQQQAAVALNRILHHPLEEPFVTEEAGVDDPLLMVGQGRLFPYVNNPRNFQVFRDFEVQEGLRVAPELHRLDSLIAAQERTVLNAARAFWAPDLAFQADVSQRYAQGGDGQSAAGGTGQDRTTFNLELGLTFPLFEGGSKNATQIQASQTLRQLQLDREATVERVEERIRVVVFQTGASAPSIRLSREAAEAARKNLELVGDQYSRGAVDIVKVLDSQNAALTANLEAANAIYDFLVDLINIQRATGQFDYFLSKEEQEAWFQRLEAFFAKEGIDTSRERAMSPFK